MKSFKLFGRIVLLFCLCGGSLGSNNVPQCNTKPNATKLEDVVWDVKTMIFENIKLPDLISVAQTSRHFSILSEDIFARKYSNLPFKLFRPKRDSNRNLSDLGDSIIVFDYDTILKILKIFGHLVKNIQLICDSAHEENMTEFSESLNAYCADSLIEINIESEHEDLFKKMTKPFRKLEVFTMQGSIESLGSNTLSFNELFPAIRHLNLGNRYIQMITNKSCIDANFAHLEYFRVTTMKYGLNKELNSEDVEKFLRKNPHIRSLALCDANRRLLELTSRILTNITNLELIFYKNKISDEDHEIVFETVTNLTTSMYEGRHDNITFPNLDELHTGIGVCPTDGVLYLIKFVRSNPHLKRVFIDDGFIYPGNVQQLSGARLNIEEITMKMLNVLEEHIINFMKNNEQMKKITINEDACYDTNIETLRDQLREKWIITTYNKKFIFTRRNCAHTCILSKHTKK